MRWWLRLANRWLWPLIIMSFLTFCFSIVCMEYISNEGVCKIYNFPYEHLYLHPVSNLQIPIGFILILYSFSFFVTYYLRPKIILRFIDLIFGTNSTSYFEKRIRYCRESNRKFNRLCSILIHLRVYTLGTFLDEHGATRCNTCLMREKAKYSRSFPTLLAAFATVFIAIILQKEDLCKTILFQIVVVFQITSLVLIMIGYDSFDTCLNEFHDKQRENEYVTKYYRRGTRLSYMGMQLIILSFLIATLAIHWIATLAGTSALFIFGYSYWFPKDV